MTEFRKYGRRPIPGKVKLKHRELGEIYAEGGDFSASGLFLRISANGDITVGDELAAELPEMGDGILLLGAEADGSTRLRVVRVTHDGVGLAFV